MAKKAKKPAKAISGHGYSRLTGVGANSQNRVSLPPDGPLASSAKLRRRSPPRAVSKLPFPTSVLSSWASAGALMSCRHERFRSVAQLTNVTPFAPSTLGKGG